MGAIVRLFPTGRIDFWIFLGLHGFLPEKCGNTRGAYPAVFAPGKGRDWILARRRERLSGLPNGRRPRGRHSSTEDRGRSNGVGEFDQANELLSGAIDALTYPDEDRLPAGLADDTGLRNGCNERHDLTSDERRSARRKACGFIGRLPDGATTRWP